MFEKSEYQKRRSALLQQFSSGILLFLGNEETGMNYKDNPYHFRQDSTFLYYFGISTPGLAAVIDADQGISIIFGDELSIDDIVWTGRQKTIAEHAEASGADQVREKSLLKVYLDQAAGQNRPVHFLPPYRPENLIRLSALLQMDINTIHASASVPFIKAVVAQRSIKSPAELQELHKAAACSADMHMAAMQMARPGMRESEVAAKIHQVALASGGNIAYPIILTVRGEILHNHYHGNMLKEGDLILNDSGAETAMGYAGDLTRTFPAGKTFTPVQRDLYQVVLQAYHKAVSLLKSGTRYLDVHFGACLELAEGLKGLGLMKGDMQEAVQQGAHALFFQCGTGHMMGLDVHDMEDLGEQYVGYSEQLQKNTTQFGLKSLRLGKELQPGYVLTVEPGIYMIPELIDRWSAERKFAGFINYDQVLRYKDFGGIRVEDDFVVTSDGAEMLGKALALNIEDIENIRAGAY